MDRFSKLNPKVNLLFFMLVIVISLVVFNPVYLFASICGAFAYNLKLNGKATIKSLFFLVVPVILFTGFFNMLFTSYGDTVLFNLFEKSFTLEGFFYGVCTGMSLGCLIIWISCYSSIMTSDKLLSVFSKIAPDISLTISMILAFLPRLRKNASNINSARYLQDADKSRLKKSINNFSALVSLTLEESIELAESMKARGFNSKRKVYSRYSFSIRDAAVICAELVLFSIVLVVRITGKAEFVFEPVIYMTDFSALGLSAFLLLCFLPLVIDFAEDVRWLYLKSRI